MVGDGGNVIQLSRNKKSLCIECSHADSLGVQNLGAFLAALLPCPVAPYRVKLFNQFPTPRPPLWPDQQQRAINRQNSSHRVEVLQIAGERTPLPRSKPPTGGFVTPNLAPRGGLGAELLLFLVQFQLMVLLQLEILGVDVVEEKKC